MLYFAYGSNMNLEHMRRLCGWHFRVLGPARLENFLFGPDGRGYANITSRNGAEVWGVLFDLDQHSLDVLDQFEGYPHTFDRQEFEVENDANEKVKAWAYIEKENLDQNIEIREEYMKRVLTGARENRLPEKWIGFLNTFLNQ